MVLNETFVSGHGEARTGRSREDSERLVLRHHIYTRKTKAELDKVGMEKRRQRGNEYVESYLVSFVVPSQMVLIASVAFADAEEAGDAMMATHASRSASRYGAPED